VLISQGKTATEASRALGISEQTYYRWRKEYGGIGTEQAHRLKELEKENAAPAAEEKVESPVASPTKPPEPMSARKALEPTPPLKPSTMTAAR